MHNSHHLWYSFSFHLLLMVPFIFAFLAYLGAVVKIVLSGKTWPLYRVILWVLGVFCALGAVTGPIGARAHADFTVHMIGHLLLGMLAPLLMVLAAPMTLILRTVNVMLARRLCLILKNKFFRFIGSPMIATVLNIGGLWVLYYSSLYNVMQENVFLHLLVHMHIFLAGYVFTLSIIYIDPAPHRLSFLHRGLVFATALSGHGILAKYIYAHPPAGVGAEQAKMAGMVMYYGGDVIELVLIIIFCYQWYKSSRPAKAVDQLYGVR
ncbi:putative membrane protein [Neobacillus bataviensis]|uniref:Putative membrane protein n=1 Tax=Neobacillus bataviensis TaxID=220685 RepID=A0A561DEL1_9BACI|nr:cytochrome c oxidase assembly protein [Neobacillus bataviensis]TWE01758.1 putative membrane protein [Neobacillus bataviensis]